MTECVSETGGKVNMQGAAVVKAGEFKYLGHHPLQQRLHKRGEEQSTGRVERLKSSVGVVCEREGLRPAVMADISDEGG